MTMKKLYLIAAALMCIFGCTVDEIPSTEPRYIFDSDIVYAEFGDSKVNTKTYLNENVQLRWNEGDCISLFKGNTYNQQYVFDGKTGDNSGSFSKASDAMFTGNKLSAIYAVYPYDNSATINEDGQISLHLPSVQSQWNSGWDSDRMKHITSFGPNTNTMVAVTKDIEDNFLSFKNVCGYLKISLFGKGGVEINSISLKGNNGEKISGAAIVTPSYSNVPTIQMSSNATETITLDCHNRDLFGTVESATDFWFVVPPVEFTKGITVNICDSEGKEMIKTTSTPITISRNTYSSMAPFEFVGAPAEYVHFEDDNFKAYCVKNFDLDGDRRISKNEALFITLINVSSDNIESLVGIEEMANLQELDCNGTQINSQEYAGKLTSLDVSKNVKLATLGCGGNSLTNLDVSNCIELKILYCAGNRLTDLKLSNSIETLLCMDNQLSGIDISNNKNITVLFCANNPLISIKASGCEKLTFIDNYSPSLESIDVSGCSSLGSMDILFSSGLKNLKNINASGCTSMGSIIVQSGALSGLNISGCTALNKLDCSHNELISLDVSNCTSLTTLNCCYNQIPSLDISDCTSLTDLDCASNQLSSLDVSGCTSLTNLRCGDNQLPSLDISKNTALSHLDCGSNQLSSLDVSDCTSLTYLRCDKNPLTSLDASKNTALTDLDCRSNQLSSLDVSGCTSLTYLDCGSNQLSSLDVSKNTVLTDLICDSNQLSSLDISKNTALSHLYCYNNQINHIYVWKGFDSTQHSGFYKDDSAVYVEVE